MNSLTANCISPLYEGEHIIFVGTHTGNLRKVNPRNKDPFVPQNLLQEKENKKSKISALVFADLDQSIILVGKEKSKCVQVFDCTNNTLKELDVKHCSVTGFAKNEDFLVCGFNNGKIERIENSTMDRSFFTSGDNIEKLKSNNFNKNVFATGGRGRNNNLKIFDLKGNQIFTSKNLPNDHLQMEVPVWDCDMDFLTENVISTCSRYGYLRVYDIRKQRRPVLKYSNDKDNFLKFTTLHAKENSIFTGATMGEMRMFDIRNLKTFVHTYKGCTGSISNVFVDKIGRELISTSLDRYLRIHSVETCAVLYQCYLKSKPTSVLVK